MTTEEQQQEPQAEETEPVIRTSFPDADVKTNVHWHDPWLVKNVDEPLLAIKYVLTGIDINNDRGCVVGWASKEDLQNAEIIDWGYGPMRSIHWSKLRKLDAKPKSQETGVKVRPPDSPDEAKERRVLEIYKDKLSRLRDHNIIIELVNSGKSELSILDNWLKEAIDVEDYAEANESELWNVLEEIIGAAQAYRNARETLKSGNLSDDWLKKEINELKRELENGYNGSMRLLWNERDGITGMIQGYRNVRDILDFIQKTERMLEIEQIINGALSQCPAESTGTYTWVRGVKPGDFCGYLVWLYYFPGARITTHQLRFVNKKLSKAGLTIQEIYASGSQDEEESKCLVLFVVDISNSPETCGCSACWNERNDISEG